MALLKRGVKGDEVKKMQQRLTDLKYLNDKVDGIFGSKTEMAVRSFQLAARLSVDGVYGPKTAAALFADNAPIYEPNTAIQEADWWKSGINKRFCRGTVATITDCGTGLSWHEERRGGSNHADVQPCTKADTTKLKQAYGGKWSWNRRPIVVTINGENFAASMNGMPHSGNSILDNDFPGHHCIHFTNSRTHNSNKVDVNHQKAIKQALLYRGPIASADEAEG